MLALAPPTTSPEIQFANLIRKKCSAAGGDREKIAHSCQMRSPKSEFTKLSEHARSDV